YGTCPRRTNGSANEMTDFLRAAVQNAPTLLRHNALSLIPVAAFAVFLYVNKGITVGTFSSHCETAHLGLVTEWVQQATKNTTNQLRILHKFRISSCSAHHCL